METVGFFAAALFLLGLVWYFCFSKRKRLDRIDAPDPEALSRWGRLLDETDTLLGQIRDISARHDAFFERYKRLAKEAQRLRNGDGSPLDNMGTVTQRAFALKQQVEKEKENLFKDP